MIKIDYDNTDVLSALTRLSAHMQDMTPVMREIAGVLADAVERAFDQERDPATGRPWEPLSDTSTLLRGGDAHPILQRSGQLAASIVSEYGKDYAMVGSNKEYAAMHQFGGRTSPASMIPDKRIPARPFLGLGQQDKDEIMQILTRYLAD